MRNRPSGRCLDVAQDVAWMRHAEAFVCQPFVAACRMHRAMVVAGREPGESSEDWA